MNTEEILIQFIRSELTFDQEDANVAVDDPLLNGPLDSLGVLRLVAFIEEKFHVRVEDEELVPENFQTVRQIAEYIHRKSAVGG